MRIGLFKKKLAILIYFYANSQSPTALPPLTADASCAINAITGYASRGGWEFDNGNGAICSPEYIAYIFKHLPMYDGIHFIISLHGSMSSGGKGSYVPLLYTEDGNCIPAGFFAWDSRSQNAKDVTHARIRNWGIPGVSACKGGAMSNCITQYPTAYQRENSCLSSTKREQAPCSTPNQLQEFLSTFLTDITQRFIPMARTVANRILNNRANGMNNAISYYKELQTNVFSNNSLSSYSVGTLGHYHALINNLLTTEPFPASDTSDTVFDKSANSFSKHAIYLMFAANKFARANILNDDNANLLIGLTVILHRFKVLQERISSENWQQNPNIADVYELIAILNVLLPGYNDGQGNFLPQLSNWNNANNAGNALENLNPAQLDLIASANSLIDNTIPHEIADLHSIKLCRTNYLISTVGNCFTNDFSLINFENNNVANTDVQLFNWVAYPALSSETYKKITKKF